MKSNPKPVSFKYLLIGDSGVGKTSLLKRYTQNKYDGDSLSTIGIDFKSKTISIPEQLTQTEHNNIRKSTLYNTKNITLNIWDTAGQQRFQTITKSFYRGTNAILLLFSVQDRGSFVNISRWIDQIMQEIQMDSSKILYLVGSKADSIIRNQLSEIRNIDNQLVSNSKLHKNQQTKRQVTYEQARQISQKYSVQYLQVSAKDDKNVDKLFQAVTYKVFKAKLAQSTFKYSQSVQPPKRLIKKQYKKKKQCC